MFQKYVKNKRENVVYLFIETVKAGHTVVDYLRQHGKQSALHVQTGTQYGCLRSIFRDQCYRTYYLAPNLMVIWSGDLLEAVWVMWVVLLVGYRVSTLLPTYTSACEHATVTACEWSCKREPNSRKKLIIIKSKPADFYIFTAPILWFLDCFWFNFTSAEFYREAIQHSRHRIWFSVISLSLSNWKQSSYLRHQPERRETQTEAKTETIFFISPVQVPVWPPRRFSRPFPTRAKRTQKDRRWTGIRNSIRATEGDLE